MPKRKKSDDEFIGYFWSHIVKGATPDECWHWTGNKNRDGYGQMYFKGKLTGTHRISHILHHGPIPEGFVILHSCLSKDCCNPLHIRAGTKKENSQDLARAKKTEEWQLARWGYVKRNK